MFSCRGKQSKLEKPHPLEMLCQKKNKKKPTHLKLNVDIVPKDERECSICYIGMILLAVWGRIKSAEPIFPKAVSAKT